MKRGIATFTLDWGTCPPWLWHRMVKLSKEILRVLQEEYGPEEIIARLGDPVWFQYLGTVLAFDWNASGLTTILTAALKEALKGQEEEMGIFIAGGKGKTSLKTPHEIKAWAHRLHFSSQEVERLIYTSKITAKVDSSLVQDGFQLYHHTFFFSKKGSWTVVQQGMNTQYKSARRYHWHSNTIQDFIIEPHSGIMSTKIGRTIALNMTAQNIDPNRRIALELINSGYDNTMKDIHLLRKHYGKFSKTATLKIGKQEYTFLNLSPVEFGSGDHKIIHEDFSKSTYLEKVLDKVTHLKPQSYEQLVAIEGVGPKTIRALALVSELIYGAPAAYTDPARYSFAHGGKDATPYPVDTKTYDHTIEIFKNVVAKTKLSPHEKNRALRNLDGI